jgi:hypothetical protein
MGKSIMQKPGESPEVIDLRKGIDHLKEIVGGCFTTVHHEALESAGVTAWAHDEGLFEHLEPNIVVYGQPIVGPVVFTGHNAKGETVALTGEQEALVRRFLGAATLNALQRYRVGQQLAELF